MNYRYRPFLEKKRHKKMEDKIKLIIRQMKMIANENLKVIIGMRVLNPMDKSLKALENKLIGQIERMENVERDNTVSDK